MTRPTSPVWTTRPVFIASTFRDMQAERDHLNDVVFPELEERLRARYHHLEPIDLRWGVDSVGVDEERSKEPLVLKVCLAEIQRSRPFLIVILGDRYGWVPEEARMRAAVQEAGFDTEVAGKSVTALEIEFGVLDSLEQQQRSFFYLRDPLPYDEMPPEVAAGFSELHNPDEGAPQAAERLVQLKRRIGAHMPERVRYYDAGWDPDRHRVTGLDTWGRQVLDDLWSDLAESTKGFAQRANLSWQEAERAALEEFIEHQGRGFVGREDTVDDILRLATSLDDASADTPAHRGACIVGEPGSGKSALFAHLHGRLHEREDVLLLGHAAGIGARPTSVDAMLRRWIDELAAFLAVEPPISEESDAEEVEAVFASLLGRSSVKTRLVLLVDALNQFDSSPRARHLTWLPKLWPDNARLVATTTPGIPAEALNDRPWIEREELRPLLLAEAEDIALAVCRRYHRTIHADVVRTLVQKGKEDGASAGNPLWLRLALEQLNLLDADDFERMDMEFTGTPDERLHQLLLDVAEKMPADVAGMYASLFRYTEDVHGRAWARGFANLIAVSRAGWRERDLKVLLPEVTGQTWDPLSFASLRRSFRAHLVPRGPEAQWDFAHTQARTAVGMGSLADRREVQQLHRSVARYLGTLPRVDPLRESETMAHLVAGDDKAGAGELLGRDVPMGGFRVSPKRLTAREEVEIVSVLTQFFDNTREQAGLALGWISSLLELPTLTTDQLELICYRILFPLYDETRRMGDLSSSIGLACVARDGFRGLILRDSSNHAWLGNLSLAYERIGDIQLLQNNLTEALSSYQSGHLILEQLSGLGLFQKLVHLVRSVRAPVRAVAQIWAWPALWLNNDSILVRKIGDVRIDKGDPSGAMIAYRNSLAIVERMPSQNNDLTVQRLSESHDKVGEAHLLMGNSREAIHSFMTALKFADLLVERDPGNAEWKLSLALIQSRIGDVLLGEGALDEALPHYRSASELIEQLLSQAPANWLYRQRYSNNRVDLGNVAAAKGDLNVALENYRLAMEITQALVDRNPENAEWQWNLSVAQGKVGSVLEKNGDLKEALKCRLRALAIVKQLAAHDPSNAAWQQGLSTDYFHVASLVERIGGDDPQHYLKRCLDVLHNLRDSGGNLSRGRLELLKTVEDKLNATRPE